MGYYTLLYVNLSAKRDEIERIRQEIERMKKLARDDKRYEWFTYYDDISVDDDGCIDFLDCRKKLYEYDKLAEWLTPFVEEGNIECHGDDPLDIWRIHFDGNGHFQIQDARIEWAVRH